MKTFFSNVFILLGGLLLLAVFTTAKGSGIPVSFILGLTFIWIGEKLGRSANNSKKNGSEKQAKIDAYLKERKRIREEELLKNKIVEPDNNITIKENKRINESKNNAPPNLKPKKSKHYVKKSSYVQASDNIGDHTYDKWQELGYQVKRGETSAYVHYGKHVFTRSQVQELGSSYEDDYDRSYENHCWNCGEHISSDSEEYCDDCEMFVCSNCGECMCGYH